MNHTFSPRFVKPEQMAELVNLYHLARVPLSGKPCTKYDRMIWASGEFAKLHPGVTATAAYKDLSDSLTGY